MGENVLIHWGRKGQQRGIRNYRGYDGKLTEEGKKRYNYYEKKTDRSYETGRAKQLGPKKYIPGKNWGDLKEDLSGYTNDELKALTERANLEKNYREAYNTYQYTKGRRFLNGIKSSMIEASKVAEAGNSLITQLSNLSGTFKRISKQASEEARRANEKAEREKNEKAVKDWILSFDDPNKSKKAQDYARVFSGGNGKGGKSNYGDITPEQLKRMKQMIPGGK